MNVWWGSVDLLLHQPRLLRNVCGSEGLKLFLHVSSLRFLVIRCLLLAQGFTFPRCLLHASVACLLPLSCRHLASEALSSFETACGTQSPISGTAVLGTFFPCCGEDILARRDVQLAEQHRGKGNLHAGLHRHLMLGRFSQAAMRVFASRIMDSAWLMPFTAHCEIWST